MNQNGGEINLVNEIGYGLCAASALLYKKELRLMPDELFAQPGMKDFLEWSSLRVWMKDWLRYCRWYFTTVMSPDPGIEEFFRAPIINPNWKVTRSDPTLIRFGLLWKIYDMVALLGVDFKVPILESKPLPVMGGYLFGGASGSDYLVVACGCDQPRANRSVIQPGRTYSAGESQGRVTIRYKRFCSSI